MKQYDHLSIALHFMTTDPFCPTQPYNNSPVENNALSQPLVDQRLAEAEEHVKEPGVVDDVYPGRQHLSLKN